MQPHFLGLRNESSSESSNESSEKNLSFIFETSDDPNAADKNKEKLLNAFKKCGLFTDGEIDGSQITCTRLCDSCDVEMDYTYLDGIRKCEDCNLQFDLCVDCQTKYPKYNRLCPPRFGCQSNIPGIPPRYSLPFGVANKSDLTIPNTTIPNTTTSIDRNNKKDRNNSNKSKGFQPKKKSSASQKPPGVKRLRGKGMYYKAFGMDMRAASANLPDPEGHYVRVQEESLITALDPLAGIYFAGSLPWNCICDMWLYFRTTNKKATEKYGLPTTLVRILVIKTPSSLANRF